MAGKRVRRKRKMRIPGAILALSAAGILLCVSGPQGAAVNSPLEEPAPSVLAGQKESAGSETDVRKPVEVQIIPEKPTIQPTAPETDLHPGKAVMPEIPVSDELPDESSDLPEEQTKTLPETEPVEDTYFDDVVFLGDSRTDGFRLYSGLKTGSYLYATGATVESVFSKSVDTPVGKMPLLDALEQMECGKIYVMLGINELGWNGTDLFRNQAAKMIERIQADHPDATIVIQSILPVSAKQDAKGSYVNNKRIAAYNQVLEELAEEYGVVYLNVAEAVSDENGYLRADWNFDGVHLNQAGCQAWLDYLRTHPVPEA